MATTHYGELKHFAYTHPRRRTPASSSTSRPSGPPTACSIGIAGQSNAFAIADRLGLDRAIIERARA